MKFPTETKPVLMGVAIGAIGLAIAGFSWGGWTTGSSAEKMAKQRAESAVVAALMPGCVAKFNAASDSAVHLAALKKTNSWEQGSYIEKGGWATAPGAAAANSDLARACAAELTKGS